MHAANSAAVLREPAAHFDMVRCGIAVYGMDPFGEDPAARGLEPALELASYVADVKRCRAGESAGLRAALRRRARHRGRACCRSATATAGGGRCPNNAEVLIGGAAPSAGGDREHGQRDRRPRSRRATSGCAASARC